jgi:hypothetical protein
LIAKLVCHWGQSEALRILESSYPVCLAAYLVAKGVYGYQDGKYWSSITEGIGLSDQRRLGLFFEHFLRERNLPYATKYSVTLNIGSEFQRTWHFQCSVSDIPLLAFEPESRILLPSGEVW